MNDDRLLGGRPDAVEWLASGPDRAPDGLLARSLARTSVSRQRSGIVAAALGAPRMTARPQAVTPIRVWLVVALLAMAATAVAIVAGWPDRNQLVVITSPEPSQSRSPGPDVPLAVQTLTHGVTVDRSAVNPWTSVRPFPGGNPELFAGKVYDFAFNDCPAGCGPHTIQVTLGTIDEGLIYGWEPCSAESFFGCLSPQTNGPTALAIHGMTTDELVTGWWAIFGPSRVTHVNVGAQTWSIADEGTRLVALIVGQDTVIAVSLGATPGIAAIDAQGRLTEFLNAIHYVPAARPTGAPVTHELGDLSVTMPGV